MCGYTKLPTLQQRRSFTPSENWIEKKVRNVLHSHAQDAETCSSSEMLSWTALTVDSDYKLASHTQRAYQMYLFHKTYCQCLHSN